MSYLLTIESSEENFTFKSGKDNPMYNRTPGHTSGNGISGYYKGNLFRSLLELECMIKFEREGFNVRANEIKDRKIPEIRIPIFYNGLQRLYVPDLIVEKDGVKSIIEIKGKKDLFLSLFGDELEEKINDLGYEYIILDHSNLRPNKVENRKNYRRLYDQGVVEIHSNKLQKFIKYENLPDFKAKELDEMLDIGTDILVV